MNVFKNIFKILRKSHNLDIEAERTLSNFFFNFQRIKSYLSPDSSTGSTTEVGGSNTGKGEDFLIHDVEVSPFDMS